MNPKKKKVLAGLDEASLLMLYIKGEKKKRKRKYHKQEGIQNLAIHSRTKS